MTVYIPENLDLDYIVKRATKNNIGPKKDYLAFVLGTVSNGLYIQKDEFDRYNEAGTPIWTYLLRKFIGKEYKRYLTFFINRNILKSNLQFFEGRSRIYSFAPEYSKSFKKYKITDAKLLRKINLYYDEKDKYAKRKLKHLYKWIKVGKLTIDAVEAESILPDKYSQKLNEKGRSKKRKEEFARIALYCWKRSIEVIHTKKYIHKFSIGESGGGRIYTSLTNTSRSFRKFIKYEGKTLCHVDISNSQPYFASLLLKTDFWYSSMLSSKDKTRMEKTHSPFTKGSNTSYSRTKQLKISPNIKKGITYHDYSSIVTLLKLSEPSINQEFNKYKKYVSSGLFYQLVAEEYNNSILTKRIATREDVKRWMFGVFFSRNPPIVISDFESPQSKIFRQLFPTISRLFEIIKEGQHNKLAVLLQNLESQALLHQVCGLIAKKHPQIPLFTIHDSIVTTVGNERVIKQIMGEELEKLTGLSPTLRVKVWDDTYDE